MCTFILYIYKSDVDMFASQSPPCFPSILITISAEYGPDTVSTLNCCMSLKGIKPDNMKIPIIRSICNTDDDGRQLCKTYKFVILF